MENNGTDVEVEKKEDDNTEEFINNKPPKKTKDGGRFRKIISALLIMDLAIFSSIPFYSILNSNRLSNDEQVYNIAEDLDADLSNTTTFLDNKVRIKNNGNEPIYVSIEDGFTDYEVDCIKKSLDFYFGIVGDINPAYKYKIVESAELQYKKILGKCVIEYKLAEEKENEKHPWAEVYSGLNIPNMMSQNKFSNRYDVNYYRLEGKSEHEIFSVFMHEAAHLFEISDVYNWGSNKTTSSEYANTITNKIVGFRFAMPTPHDYACLISLYAPQASEQNYESIKEEYKQKLSDYEKFYYSEYIKLCRQEINEEKKSEQKVVEFNKSDPVEIVGYSICTENFQDTSQSVKITINNNLYEIKICDSDGNVLDSTKGEAVLVDGSWVLKNARFKLSVEIRDQDTTSGYFTDFVVLKYENFVRAIALNGDDVEQYTKNEVNKEK